MRPIDADALKAEIQRRRKRYKTLTGVDMAMLVDDAPTIDSWISIKNRLPKISGHYLVSCVTNKTGHRWKVSVNAEWLTSRHEWYIETENCLATAAGVTVTHYMPLPEPPEEGDQV